MAAIILAVGIGMAFPGGAGAEPLRHGFYHGFQGHSFASHNAYSHGWGGRRFGEDNRGGWQHLGYMPQGMAARSDSSYGGGRQDFGHHWQQQGGDHRGFWHEREQHDWAQRYQHRDQTGMNKLASAGNGTPPVVSAGGSSNSGGTAGAPSKTGSGSPASTGGTNTQPPITQVSSGGGGSGDPSVAQAGAPAPASALSSPASGQSGAGSDTNSSGNPNTLASNGNNSVDCNSPAAMANPACADNGYADNPNSGGPVNDGPGNGGTNYNQQGSDNEPPPAP